MSYDVTVTFKEAVKGNIELSFWAGSYEELNCPDYGHDWEYYHVDLIIVNKDQDKDDQVKEYQYGRFSEAELQFNKLVNKYDLELTEVYQDNIDDVKSLDNLTDEDFIYVKIKKNR